MTDEKLTLKTVEYRFDVSDDVFHRIISNAEGNPDWARFPSHTGQVWIKDTDRHTSIVQLTDTQVDSNRHIRTMRIELSKVKIKDITLDEINEIMAAVGNELLHRRPEEKDDENLDWMV